MVKKNQYELIDDSIIADGVFKLEPYDDWKENIAFWIAQYLSQKCDEQSRRFVTEDNIPKIISIKEAILNSKDIEAIGKYVNELGVLKFKAIKQYYNNIYPMNLILLGVIFIIIAMYFKKDSANEFKNYDFSIDDCLEING